MATDEYSIGELAELSGVTRRTVRYYVQEGLIPPPRSLGRGACYGREHLDKLLEVKGMQERGLSLDEIRLRGRERRPEKVRSPERSLWSRIELAPGVELHVSSRNQVPSPSKLAELTAWARTNLRPKKENDDA